MTDRSANSAWPYLGIFALALGVRAVYLLEWSDTVLWSVLIGDGRGYDAWAREIAGGDWFGSEVFYQAPFYPYLMGAVYSLTGPSVGALRVLQVLLGSASCVLLALAGTRFFSRPVGLAAGAILALYAPALFYDGLVQKASLGGFLLVLWLALLGEFHARRGWIWMAGAGVVLAAYALTRENALLLLPLTLVWLLVARGVPRTQASLALVLGAALLLAPVAMRNYSLGEGLQLTTAQLGPNLYIGNHEGATGRYVPLRAGRGSSRFERSDAVELAEAATGRELAAGEVSSYWLGRTFEDIIASPRGWLRLMAVKLRLTWNAEELMDTDYIGVYTDESVLLRALGWLFHFGTLAPLALVGIWATRKEAPQLWLLWATLAALSLGPLLFFVTGRYRYPLVPVLALFAGAGLLMLVHSVRARDWKTLAVDAALLAVAAVLSNWPLGLHPDPRSGTHYALGLALKQESRYDDALRELRRAVSLWPESPDVHLQLGQVHFFRRDFLPAQASFDESIRLAPDRADAHVGLGMVHSAQGDGLAASESYRRAITLDPMNVDANNNYAALLTAQGRWSEAAAHFQAAAQAEPGQAEIIVNLATAQFQTGRLDEALESYRTAIALNPGFAGGYYGVGRVLDAQGRRGAAADVFGRLLQDAGAAKWPFSGDALVRMADYLATCREPEIRAPDNALQLADAARQTGPEFESLSALAAARAATGDFAAAIRSSDSALRLADRLSIGAHLLARERDRQAEYRAGRAVFQECPL